MIIIVRRLPDTELRQQQQQQGELSNVDIDKSGFTFEAVVGLLRLSKTKLFYFHRKGCHRKDREGYSKIYDKGFAFSGFFKYSASERRERVKGRQKK